MMKHIRSSWSRSGWYRLGLSLSLAFFGIRAAGQVYYLFIVSPMEMGSFHSVFVPNDLKDYLEAAERFSLKEDLYLPGKLDRVEFYQYSPAYALCLTPLLHLHPTLIVVLDTLLHIAAYIALYHSWRRIFKLIGLPRGEEMLAWTLPLWLVFEPFWSDLAYLNIYILVALAATWLIEAILCENLALSVFWTVVLLLVKPFWAFAVGVPLILGNRKFFWKLMAWTVSGYLTIAVATILAADPSYVLRQYADYFHFLAGMSTNFPWRGPDLPFLGYNHSVMQIVLFFAGISSTTILVAKVIKYVILLPLIGLGTWLILHPVQKKVDEQYKLEWAFTLYLGVFIFLDIIWEVSLGLAIFAYLLAVTDNRVEQILASVVFIPYCLLDLWRFLSYLIWGDKALSGAYILTDPSTYIPMILSVLLVFYAILLRRLLVRATTPRLGDSDQSLSPGRFELS